jgi:hypothetical protein
MARARVAVLLALCGACALNNQLTDGGAQFIFDIGDIHFRVSSGTGRTASGLTLYLTDQPDACLAVTQVPVGRATILSLKVAAQADGTPAANVVANVVTPGPGQAVGAIIVEEGGVEAERKAAVDGTIGWTANTDGTYTLVAVDIGFEGATGRVHVDSLTVPGCQP